MKDFRPGDRVYVKGGYWDRRPGTVERVTDGFAKLRMDEREDALGTPWVRLENLEAVSGGA